MPETGFDSAADAAGQLEASLDYLAATDWVSLGTQAHGEMLARLQQAQAQLTAVNAAVLAAFTAQSGYEPDGHRSAMAWLTQPHEDVPRRGGRRDPLAAATGPARRHRRRDGGRDRLRVVGEGHRAAGPTRCRRRPRPGRPDPPGGRGAGVPLEDLEMLARSIWETWKAQHPDPDDGNGEPGDEDGFGDRRLRLGVTFGGAGKLTGDLAAGLRRQAAGDLRRARQAPRRVTGAAWSSASTTPSTMRCRG